MKFIRSKKNIILGLLLVAFVVLLFSSNTIYAEVNGSYSSTDGVTNVGLDSAIEDSDLLEVLVKLIFAVGRFFEWILGVIFKLLTKSSDFPWSDKIVFNAVPLLDVNFFNPAKQSFVWNSQIQAVLKNLYSTLLAIAATFFGITVMITAIKLVISTIASDKAKYKQAIVDWAVGFVLLFCIHYFISFTFYLNEQLVEVASKIVKQQLEGKTKIAKTQAGENTTKLIESIPNSLKYNGKKVKDILKDNIAILTAFINLSVEEDSRGLQEYLMKDTSIIFDSAIDDNDQYKRLAMIVSWAAAENISISDLQKIRNNYIYVASLSAKGNFQAIRESDENDIFKTYFSEVKEIHKEQYSLLTPIKKVKDVTIKVSTTSTKATRKELDDDENLWLSAGANHIGNTTWLTENSTTTFEWTNILDDLITIKAASKSSTGKYLDGGKYTLIPDLATYFKQNAYEKTFDDSVKTGLTDGDNIYIQNMIMYTILVAQSLILFIAYVKRLFYVIMLAMMAPIVVVFDFFQKFGK